MTQFTEHILVFTWFVSREKGRVMGGKKEGSWYCSDKCYDDKQSRIKGRSGRRKEGCHFTKGGRKDFFELMTFEQRLQ